jgi:hypothetical protein
LILDVPLLSLSYLQFPLRVGSRFRAFLLLNSGGAAARGREGWKARLVQSRVRRFGLMLVFGLMPLGGNGVLDLGQIQCYLGFFSIVLMLQRLKLAVMEKTTVFLNKAMARCLFLIWQLLMSPLSLAGQGGEGRIGGGMRICWFGSWWGKMLQDGDSHMVAFDAAMILGRRCGLSLVLLVRHPINHLWWPLFSGSASALFFSSIPSGRFPGDGGGGRRRGLLAQCGGGSKPGPDCFFSFCSRVFYATYEGQDVILFLVEFLSVNVSHR